VLRLSTSSLHITRIMNFRSVTGTEDTLPPEIYKWHFIEAKVREVFNRFGYEEIRTPIFEETALFARGIGETTDIVGKEMYSFSPSEKESLTLRPEMTAGVVRSFLEHELYKTLPLTKVYYIAPLFRKERPQKGRYRQFWQFGAECFGSTRPEADAEMIAMMTMIYDELGIRNNTMRLNSLGNLDTRLRYRTALQAYLRPHYELLDDVSKVRFEKNPLRILDSKNPALKDLITNAPRLVDFLDEPSAAHFDAVKKHLDTLGVRYVIDHRLVRGLDYYSHTAFELTSSDLGAQDALGGGGRYDGLAKALGHSADFPAIGFASGIERLILAMDALKLFDSVPRRSPDVMLVAQSGSARDFVMHLAQRLRKKGIAVETDLLQRSLKAQMREANRTGARYAVIIGDNELQSQKFQLKNLSDSTQAEFTEAEIEKKLLAKSL
jgi:histidyl-tRNA synthetase